MTDTLARLSGIERRFGSVVALNGADLTLRSGEVHGLLGANGAGKTTLLNILGGMVRPHAGTVELAGSVVAFDGPRDAWEHGIALVHQHFTLVPALSVFENLVLGVRRPMTVVRSDIEVLQSRTGLYVPLEARAEDLGVGDRQRVEILKALLRSPTVLALDEPTAVLSPVEVETLFALLRGLAADGRAVVMVAHKLDEVLGVADRVTVLREGRTVLSSRPGALDVPGFVRAMVGTEVPNAVAIGLSTASDRRAGLPGEQVAQLHRVVVGGGGAGPGLRGASMVVRRGEIVGIAGVAGNGQRELARVLGGRLVVNDGKVMLPSNIGFIPQDRTVEGLIADFEITENVALALHRVPSYQSGPWLKWGKMTGQSERLLERYQVAVPSVRSRAGALSGGNQQRVVVARELSMAGDLLVAENPTRGLDVAATSFVHQEIASLSDAGVGVVLISTDLDEVLALSDRVIVISNGYLREVADDRRTRESVGTLMLNARTPNG